MYPRVSSKTGTIQFDYIFHLIWFLCSIHLSAADIVVLIVLIGQCSLATRYSWLSLVSEQQLTIWACSVIAEHAQIVSCCSETNDNQAYQQSFFLTIQMLKTSNATYLTPHWISLFLNLRALVKIKPCSYYHCGDRCSLVDMPKVNILFTINCCHCYNEPDRFSHLPYQQSFLSSMYDSNL